MAFKLLEKGVFIMNAALSEGWASIDKSGSLRMHKSTMELVGIDGCAVVLTDEMSLRIALRKPRPNEGRNAYRVSAASVFGKGEVKHLQVSIKRALNELRIDPPSATGRYEVMTKDDLLIISLTKIGDLGADSKDDDDAE